MVKLSRRQKKNLARIIISLALFFAILIPDKISDLSSVIGGGYGWVLPFALYLTVYVIIGYDVLWRAARNIAHGQVFDENFLMCVATLGAFGLAVYLGATGQKAEGFDEACAVLIFYQVGEFFQNYATEKSRKSISSLMDIRPDYANVIRNGEVVTVDPSEVEVGETIAVNAGEKIPLDGTVIKGETNIDTRALTGESLPRDVKEGETVISGTLNLTSRIEVMVEKAFYDSTVTKILDLVENASASKSKAENFITKFARIYTPIIVFSALALALIPSFITGEWQTWIYRALSFLVVSCPCALVISVPLSFFAGLGAASSHGILIKGSNYLEKINKANVFVFDKTGTLTKGNFAVTAAFPEEREEEILRLASIAENGSGHPIAKSIAAKYGKPAEGGYSLTNIAGEGVIAEKEGEKIFCGNEKLMKRAGAECAKPEGVGTVVYVAKNGEFIGSLLIADEIKEETAEVIKELNASGAKTFMLTGDNEEIAKSVALKAGLSGYKASLLPQDKVSEVEKMFREKSEKDVLCFVGDGINDAPVLTRADVGVAMGGVGSDAAIEAADVVLMKDDLRGIAKCKKIAKKTMRIVFENIIFSLAVKVAILVLSALGIANMWIAVFGDVGVAVIAILNAMRVGRYKE